MIATAAACLLAPAAVASADNSPEVVSATVYTSGSGQPQTDTASFQQLSGCSGNYQVNLDLHRRSGTDEPLQFGGPPAPDNGDWSLPTVLQCIGIKGSIQGVVVGGAAPLTNADLTSGYPGGPNQTPGALPVVQYQGSTVLYARPWSGNPSDYNVGDESEGAGPLSIEVYEGQPISVSVTPPSETVSTGTSVAFSATAAGTPSATFSWNFDDGGAAGTGADVSHTFAGSGTYQVVVTATDTSGDVGSASTTITVSAANQTPPASGSTPQPGNGAPSPSPSSTGPAHSKGSTHGGVPGVSAQAPQRATHGAGHASTPSASPHGATPAATTRSAASPGAASATAAPTTKRHPAATPGRHVAPPRPTPPGQRLVNGLLISDVVPVAPADSSLTATRPGHPGTAIPVRRGVRVSIVPAVAATLAIVLLLALGAGRELRGQRRWRTLRLGA